MNRETDTGPPGQFRDANGIVVCALAVPTRRQRRSRAGLARDYRATRPALVLRVAPR